MTWQAGRGCCLRCSHAVSRRRTWPAARRGCMAPKAQMIPLLRSPMHVEYFRRSSTRKAHSQGPRHSDSIDYPRSVPGSWAVHLSKISLVETALILPFTPLILPSAPPAVTDLKIAKTRLNLWTSDSVLQSTGALHLRDVLVFFFFAIPKRAPHESVERRKGEIRCSEWFIEYKKIFSYRRDEMEFNG